MKWVLVTLTIQGGIYRAQSDLVACQRHLARERISQTREVYCMSQEHDAVFYLKNGKQIAAIR